MIERFNLMAWILLAIALGAFTIAVTVDVACASGSCGLRPIKPLVPLGCNDLVATCQCDAQGRNCYWVWSCI